MSESGESGSGGAGPDQSRPDIGGAGAGGGPRPSGLRNPAGAVRGVGAAALGAQGVTLLLAVVPLRVLGVGGIPVTVVLLVLAGVSLALAGLLRHRWAWWVGGLVPLAQIVCGFVVHPALGAAGLVFGLVWLYVLRIRFTILRSISRRPDATA